MRNIASYKLSEKKVEKLRRLFPGKFGLERETLRVDEEGKLAQTEHPFEEAAFARDFCENQLELVTPACDSIGAMLQSLEDLDCRARTLLQRQGETLWLYSNPPHIDSDREIPIARFLGEHSEKFQYRKNLEYRYGKRLMLYSGIHFNFSFSEETLQQFYKRAHCTCTFRTFQDDLYFRLYQQLSRYSWLLVLLTASSPVYDASFDTPGTSGEISSPYGSMRSSERGYWNQFLPELDYTDLSHYVASIQRYLDKGMLFSAGELYLPVRLKPRGQNSLAALTKNGVDHVELRMFDLNPLEPLGIARADLEFAYCLALYLLGKEPFDYSASMQEQAIKNHRAAASFSLDTVEIDGVPVSEAASRVLSEMKDFFAEDSDSLNWIEQAERKITGKRQCQRVQQEIRKKGMKLVAMSGRGRDFHV